MVFAVAFLMVFHVFFHGFEKHFAESSGAFDKSSNLFRAMTNFSVALWHCLIHFKQIVKQEEYRGT